MKLEKTICPYCGAGLKIEYGQKTVECQYCKSAVLIQDDENKTADEKTEYELYPTDTDRNRKGTEPAAGRRFNRLIPPPGFRTKNALHMIIAVAGYLLIILCAREIGTVLDGVFFTVMSLSAVDIFTNWTGLFSGLPGVCSRNMLIRILMKTVWSLVVSIVWVLVMVSIEMIFGI